MIRNKKALIASAVILVVCMSLYFPFPTNEMIYARSTFMTFPITDQNGNNVLAIIGAFLFIFAILFLVIGISKYHIRTVIGVLIAYALLPQGLIALYQETMADGIAAISYDGKGTCDFEREGEDELTGECNLPIVNHSREAVTFELEFLDTFFPGDGTRYTSLMNVNGPYKITIEPNQKKSFRLKEWLDVSDIPHHIDSGGFMDVHFKIMDGERERVL
jgi:hypothetical protein